MQNDKDVSAFQTLIQSESQKLGLQLKIFRSNFEVWTSDSEAH